MGRGRCGGEEGGMEDDGEGMSEGGREDDGEGSRERYFTVVLSQKPGIKDGINHTSDFEMRASFENCRPPKSPDSKFRGV